MKLQYDTSAYETVFQPLREHWPEYLMEGALLGLYMMSAGIFAVLLQVYPSPIHGWIKSSFFRRLLYGLAMGMTSIALVYSPWGRQSGAHANSAITFTYWRLAR
jgi:aquaporin Z